MTIDRLKRIKKIYCMLGFICMLIFVIALLVLFVVFMDPSILKLFGYADKLVIAEALDVDPSSRKLINGLVNNGSIVGLKDIWSFQASYYQTIITFLIAINGLIAALSILYIKSSSEEKAEETTKKYIEGEYFNSLLARRLKEESNETFRQAQKDFESSAIKLEDALTTLDRLEKENLTLRQQVRVVSQKVAMLDNEESAGSAQMLTKGDN